MIFKMWGRFGEIPAISTELCWAYLRCSMFELMTCREHRLNRLTVSLWVFATEMLHLHRPLLLKGGGWEGLGGSVDCVSRLVTPISI